MAEHSPAERFGVWPGDELRSMNGQVPRDVIEYQLLADESIVELEVVRGGVELEVTVVKQTGEPLGLEISAAIFDRVPHLRQPLRVLLHLPAAQGHAAQLVREGRRLQALVPLRQLHDAHALHRRSTSSGSIDQRLSPLYVSIHATDPDVRSAMLRNRRGAISLRWLRCLLDNGIEVHGQVVVCPGVNDAAVLHGTLAGVLDRFPELVTVAVVPSGRQPLLQRARDAAAHDPEGEADRGDRARVAAALQPRRSAAKSYGRRTSTTCSPACRFLSPAEYEGFPQHENGVGMVRCFEQAFEVGVTPAGRRREGTRQDRLLRLGRGRACRGLPRAADKQGQP